MQQANSTDGLTSATDVAPACSMESECFICLAADVVYVWFPSQVRSDGHSMILHGCLML